MLKKEFDEKYEMDSVTEEFSKFMFVDIFIIDGLMMMFVFVLVIMKVLAVTAVIGIIAVTLGFTYWSWKQKRKNKILDNNFMDLTVYCKDGYVVYQPIINKYEMVKDNELIIINDSFVFDTTALFKGGYNIHEAILSYIDDSDVLTKYGVGKAPCVAITTTYEGEGERDGKTLPTLMIRMTAPLAMELSR